MPLLGMLIAFAFGVAAASASGSTWTAVKLPDPSVQAALYGASCSAASLCVVAGANSTIASSTNPTGGARAWSVVRPGGGADIPSAPSEDPIFAGAQIRGVSCPSDGLCVAASFDGRIYNSTAPSSASAWKVVPLSAEKTPRVHMGGVSCPSPSFCLAVAYAGKIAYSTNPAGDKLAWTVTELGQPFDLRGVSCPSVSLCVAVGNEGTILTSTDPTGGPSAWRSAGAPAGPHSINAISCPSPSLCVTGSAGGIVASTKPAGGASSWNVVSGGTGLPIKGVSCPSTSACAAIDNNADVIVSTNPTGGPAAWWFKNVLPFGSEGPGDGNGMFSLSCPLISLCVAAGQDSQIVTSTDPFVEDAPARRKSKRPRVVITGHPPKRVNHRKGGVKVTFRFRVVGKATRIKCKVEGRSLRTCRSPMRYRVTGGKHRFRVRAIAPGGAKGPPTTFHFRVGRLTERPPYGSCPSQPDGPPTGACIPNG
jgi:hypothetical protein